MEVSDKLETWRGQLFPWLYALRSAGLRVKLPPLHDVSDLESQWFSITVPFPPTDDPNAWMMKTFEAMELMDLLARVDCDCAWRLLYENGNSHTERMVTLYGEALWNWTGAPLRPKYSLEFQGCDDEEGDLQIMATLRRLMQNDSHPLSQEFDDLVILLLSHVAAVQGGRELDRGVDGYVEFNLDVEMTHPATSYDSFDVYGYVKPTKMAADACVLAAKRQLANIRDLALLPLKQSSHFAGIYPRRFQERGVFKLVSCRLEFPDIPLDDELANAICDLLEEGVHLSHIGLMSIYSTGVESAAAQRLLKTVFKTGSNPVTRSPRIPASIEVRVLDDEAVRLLFAAVARSKGLRGLHFNPECKQDLSDVESDIEQVPSDQDATIHQAPASAYWMWLAHALFSGHASNEIDTLQINVQSLSVDHVRLMREVMLMSSTSMARPHHIRHLTIDSWMTQPVGSIIELLKVVGRPITRLTLRQLGPSEQGSILDAVFLHCPNLRRLDMDVCHVETLDWFNHQYKPSFKLETLALGELDLTDFWSWPSVFTTLSNPTHPLTKSLRHLHVDFQELTIARRTYEAIGVERAMYNALVVMLNANNRLERIEVTQCNHGMAREFMDRVLVHQHELLAPQKDLGTRVCAVMSVIMQFERGVDVENAASETSKPMAMSQDIVKLILAFARPTARRISGFYPGHVSRHSSFY